MTQNVQITLVLSKVLIQTLVLCKKKIGQVNQMYILDFLPAGMGQKNGDS